MKSNHPDQSTRPNALVPEVARAVVSQKLAEHLDTLATGTKTKPTMWLMGYRAARAGRARRARGGAH